MALTICKECGGKISTDADNCPHCGRKISRTSVATIIIGGFFAFVVGSCIVSQLDRDKPKELAAPNPIAQAAVQQTKGKPAPNKPSAAVAMLRKTTDDIKGESFYYDRSSPTYSNRPAFMIYIGARNDGKWLRFRTTYAGSDWLFVKRFIVKADVYTYESPELAFERDHHATVWEWIDVDADPLVSMLVMVAASKKTVLRFEGLHYRKDRLITAEEKRAIKHVLQAYAEMAPKSQP